MARERTYAEIEFRGYESVDFGLDRENRPPNLIYHFTRQHRGPHMRIRTRDRMGFCAALITDGEAVFRHLGREAPLQRGSVFLRRPNEPYEFFKRDPHDLHLIMIMFDPAIDRVWDDLIDPGRIAVQLCDAGEVIDFTSTFFDLLQRTSDDRITLANPFAELFLRTVLGEDLRGHSQADGERWRTERCLRYVKKHYRELRSIEEIAGACGCSRSRLYTLFGKHADCTPKEYLERLKIRSACDFLMRTDWTLEHIAGEVGYADGPTFSKAFKRRTGTSPKGWRQRIRSLAH
ncbi:helix-turn-helix domain-containing protein [Kiritimatiella glycovorans]|uniref:AraC family transcriptional regulator n=1 Tax=Kiritimatiella glycovorans TaxID=1307763 RepID=A0A0G3EGS3_9BACT|nr:AraC family transcriptional regulator [Kiritimatiella glycovorans]AKJ65676.1 AraC family transcriptional regulator [Kiritimatiella glycovorans]